MTGSESTQFIDNASTSRVDRDIAGVSVGANAPKVKFEMSKSPTVRGPSVLHPAPPSVGPFPRRAVSPASHGTEAAGTSVLTLPELNSQLKTALETQRR